jgi:hypothetical protein
MTRAGIRDWFLTVRSSRGNECRYETIKGPVGIDALSHEWAGGKRDATDREREGVKPGATSRQGLRVKRIE